VLPRQLGDAPALLGGHAWPLPSISAFTTQQRSDSVPMPSWRHPDDGAQAFAGLLDLLQHPSRSRQLTSEG